MSRSLESAAAIPTTIRTTATACFRTHFARYHSTQPLIHTDVRLEDGSNNRWVQVHTVKTFPYPKAHKSLSLSSTLSTSLS